MTFTSSLGIIFGANIGATITRWLVAVVGSKLKLGTMLLPFIGQFARFVKSCCRKQSIYITDYDEALLQTPGFALTAVQEKVLMYYIALLSHIESICLEAIRWLDRVSHHVTRIALHIQKAVLASGK